jgi:ethanolamine utilization protein EutN
MQLGRIVGHATSTVKHASMNGWRLLIVQMLGVNGEADGEPVLAVDSLGAGVGEIVVACNEGGEARKLIGSKTSPVRWLVIGVKDS